MSHFFTQLSSGDNPQPLLYKLAEAAWQPFIDFDRRKCQNACEKHIYPTTNVNKLNVTKCIVFIILTKRINKEKRSERKTDEIFFLSDSLFFNYFFSLCF